METCEKHPKRVLDTQHPDTEHELEEKGPEE